jgi:hypothetical protein
MKKTIEKIINYFKENEEIFNACIEELDSYNSYLGDDRYYYMEDISEFYNGTDLIELLNRAYFGRDDDNWHTNERGEKIYDSFNPNREYFYYNGYGNLVSSNYKDYSCHLDEYAVNSMIKNRNYIYTIEEDEELTALFNELEEGEK